MRIQIHKPKDPSLPPSWPDVEVTDGDGKLRPFVKSISLSIGEGNEPVTATIEEYVSGVDVHVAAGCVISGQAVVIGNEESYNEGKRRALINLARHLCRELADCEQDPSIHRRVLALEAERLEVVSCLRRLCAEYGDNDWPDDLHIVDVIERHVAWGKYASVNEEIEP